MDIWGEWVGVCGELWSENDRIEVVLGYWVCLNFDISFMGKDCFRVCL